MLLMSRVVKLLVVLSFYFDLISLPAFLLWLWAFGFNMFFLPLEFRDRFQGAFGLIVIRALILMFVWRMGESFDFSRV